MWLCCWTQKNLSNTTTTGNGNATTTTSPNEPNNDDEDVLLQNQAQQILDKIADLCHSICRLFCSAGKFEQDHCQAGLHYWFVYDCGQVDSGGDADGNRPQQLGEGLATVAYGRRQSRHSLQSFHCASCQAAVCDAESTNKTHGPQHAHAKNLEGQCLDCFPTIGEQNSALGPSGAPKDSQ
ncbi:hypothetical protein ACA910_013501 [Epithemia clementina (nom. ined.)]